jgi:nitrogen fixation NifU-like protein
MKMAIKVNDDRIAEVRYRTRGCVAAIAAGSCLTEMIAGKSLPEAAALNREQLVEELGGLTNASMHASHLALDVLQQLLAKLKSGI